MDLTFGTSGNLKSNSSKMVWILYQMNLVILVAGSSNKKVSGEMAFTSLKYSAIFWNSATMGYFLSSTSAYIG